MAAIAKLKAMLGMDSSDYKANMKGSTQDTKKFQKAISSVGRSLAAAFSVGALVSFGKAFKGWAVDLVNGAQSAGVLTSEMLALNDLAVKNNADTQLFTKILARMKVRLHEAARGEIEVVEAFENLNLNIHKLIRLNPTEQLRTITQAAMKTGMPLETIADLLGEKIGVKGMVALQALAKDGIGPLNEELAKTLEDVRKVDDELQGIWNNVKKGAAGAISWIQRMAAALGEVQAAEEADAPGGMTIPGAGRLAAGVPTTMDDPALRRRIKALAEMKRREREEAKAEAERRAAEEKARQDELARIAEETERKKAQAAVDALAEKDIAMLKEVDKEKEKNAAIERAQLDGLAKIDANFEAAMDKIDKRREKANDLLKVELDHQKNLLTQNYKDDVEAFLAAEDEKVAKERGDREKEREQTIEAARQINEVMVSSIQRIGGIIGGGGEAGKLNVAMRTLNVQTEMKALMIKQNASLDEIKTALWDKAGMDDGGFTPNYFPFY